MACGALKKMYRPGVRLDFQSCLKLPSLVWSVLQLGALKVKVYGQRASKIEKPGMHFQTRSTFAMPPDIMVLFSPPLLIFSFCLVYSFPVLY